MLNKLGRLTGVAVCMAIASAAGCEELQVAVVVPTVIIEMGQTIRADQLALRSVPLREEEAIHHFRSMPDVAGNVARRRLNPAQPIRVDAIRGRPIFAIGSTVLIRYARAGITIDTVGYALQNGAVGERVRVKNVSSSVVVQGVVGIDGVIYVPGI